MEEKSDKFPCISVQILSVDNLKCRHVYIPLKVKHISSLAEKWSINLTLILLPNRGVLSSSALCCEGYVAQGHIRLLLRHTCHSTHVTMTPLLAKQ